MFLNKLTNNECEAFLSLSYHAAMSNGVLDDSEMSMIQEYCKEMDFTPFVVENVISMETVIEIVKEAEETSKKIIVLELMGLMYADGGFDEEERKFMNSLIEKINGSEELLQTLEGVLVRYLDVVKEVVAAVF